MTLRVGVLIGDNEMADDEDGSGAGDVDEEDMMGGSRLIYWYVGEKNDARGNKVPLPRSAVSQTRTLMGYRLSTATLITIDGDSGIVLTVRKYISESSIRIANHTHIRLSYRVE
jgi:hypothetical protein